MMGMGKEKAKMIEREASTRARRSIRPFDGDGDRELRREEELW